MTVVVDTNVLLQALRAGHACEPILRAWIGGRLNLAVSTDILLEYQEVITRLGGADRWRKFSRLLDLAELTSGNLLRITPKFRFHVISVDPDDNKFVDCAVAAEAEFILTEDAHFLPLLTSGYLPRPISPREFSTTILQLQ